MKHLLITGGAGYIGSHQVHYLNRLGVPLVVLDNLSQGKRAFVPEGIPFFEGDVADKILLKRIFGECDVEGVIHFAGASCVSPSLTDPLYYYQNNVVATCQLLASMKEAGVSILIFSSSAAVYGNPLQIPISENQPLSPCHPYGRTKMMVESMLQDAEHAYGLKFAALRYFNAAGNFGGIGEAHEPESHLIPLLLRAVKQREVFYLNGEDFETKDGSCVRDFVHVRDLVEAHWRAFQYLRQKGKSLILNLGSGSGYSVKEVIAASREITGREVKLVKKGRRAGDVTKLIADIALAERTLDWKPLFDLQEMIATAWQWENR